MSGLIGMLVIVVLVMLCSGVYQDNYIDGEMNSGEETKGAKGLGVSMIAEILTIEKVDNKEYMILMQQVTDNNDNDCFIAMGYSEDDKLESVTATRKVSKELENMGYENTQQTRYMEIQLGIERAHHYVIVSLESFIDAKPIQVFTVKNRYGTIFIAHRGIPKATKAKIELQERANGQCLTARLSLNKHWHTPGMYEKYSHMVLSNGDASYWESGTLTCLGEKLESAYISEFKNNKDFIKFSSQFDSKGADIRIPDTGKEIVSK